LSFGITPQGNIFSRKLKLLSDALELRKIIKQLQPDIIIATEYPFAITAVLMGGQKKAKLISWEHHHLYELQKNYFWERMFKVAYPRMNLIVCLNEDEKNIFKKINSNVNVIPNFISITPLINKPTSKTILTIGRLTAVKGTDLLLKTAKIVLTKYPDWKWKLIGHGDMEENVMKFIHQENLAQNLVLTSPLSYDLKDEYNNSAIYVCTSRNESFGMTLIEAMASGTPCIAFDCETGPRHIITNNEDGILVENESPEKLATAISSLILNEPQRKKMGEKAAHNVQRFSPERIYKLWEQVF